MAANKCKYLKLLVYYWCFQQVQLFCICINSDVVVYCRYSTKVILLVVEYPQSTLKGTMEHCPHSFPRTCRTCPTMAPNLPTNLWVQIVGAPSYAQSVPTMPASGPLWGHCGQLIVGPITAMKCEACMGGAAHTQPRVWAYDGHAAGPQWAPLCLLWAAHTHLTCAPHFIPVLGPIVGLDFLPTVATHKPQSMFAGILFKNVLYSAYSKYILSMDMFMSVVHFGIHWSCIDRISLSYYSLFYCYHFTSVATLCHSNEYMVM